MRLQVRNRNPRGATLIEAVIAIGVLAVAIPLVFGALGEAGKTNRDSDSANRSTVIVSECINAVERSRRGAVGWFDATSPGTAFPPAGETWALAFREDGRIIGRIDQNEYDSGLRTKEQDPVRYIASISAQAPAGAAQTDPGDPPTLLQLTIQLEYPAFQEAAKRKSQRFHSLLR